MTDVRITRITVHGYAWSIRDCAPEGRRGLDPVYTPGGTYPMGGAVTVIETDAGVSGESVGALDAQTARFLLGRSALEHELLWHQLRRTRRSSTNTPPSVVDLALWDLKGKLAGLAVWQLLGGWRTSLPCYASTYHGDEHGGLAAAADYGAFATHCRDEFGLNAFKIHGWIDGELRREIATVAAVREALGDSGEIMVDPAGTLATFNDAVELGRACDEARCRWLEDPLPEVGISHHAHALLRERVRTPLLMGEHIRGLESKADAIHARATDIVRADPGSDGGITGVMKIAALAQAHGLDVELHAGGVAQRHCMAALGNSAFYELGLLHPKAGTTHAPLYADPQYNDGLHSVDSHGHVRVPDGPGLGAEIDWDFVQANATSRAVYE